MKIFVANIPFHVSGTGIRQLFELFGVVTAVKIITEKTGKSKGFGFVEMENEQQGQKAITQLNGSTIDDRDIVVKMADHQSDEEENAHKRPRLSFSQAKRVSFNF